MKDEKQNNGTAAERYRALLASRRPTYEVTSPSGMEWTLRRVSPQDYFLANQMPFQVAQKVAEAAAKGQSEGDAMRSLTSREQMEWLVFIQKLVRDAVVSPRIVDVAREADEIDFVLEEDFEFLAAEVMGGDAAKAAATFRRGPRQDALGRAHGEKRRRKA